MGNENKFKAFKIFHFSLKQVKQFMEFQQIIPYNPWFFTNPAKAGDVYLF